MSSVSLSELQLHLAAIVASSDDAILSQDLTETLPRGTPPPSGFSDTPRLRHRAVDPPDRSSGALPGRGRRPAADSCGDSVDHDETVRIRKDGRRIDVSLTVSPIVTPEGEISAPRRSRATSPNRERLERDARHFAAIVESSDDAIVSKDLERDDRVLEPCGGTALRLHGG